MTSQTFPIHSTFGIRYRVQGTTWTSSLKRCSLGHSPTANRTFDHEREEEWKREADVLMTSRSSRRKLAGRVMFRP
jgi:hypothetical protein